MELIDTHTHLDFPDFDTDRRELLKRSRALGVGRMVVLGVYRDNWQRVWDLVQSDPQLHAALGLHPVYLDEHRPEDVDDLRDWLGRLAGHPQLCAVGEFGLDYFLAQLDRERQQALFEAQLKLAADFELPALLHVRRSHAATIATLKRFRLARGGIIHAFAGDALPIWIQARPRWCRHLAASAAPEQGDRRAAAGGRRAGNRFAGHGPGDVPRHA